MLSERSTALARLLAESNQEIVIDILKLVSAMPHSEPLSLRDIVKCIELIGMTTQGKDLVRSADILPSIKILIATMVAQTVINDGMMCEVQMLRQGLKMAGVGIVEVDADEVTGKDGKIDEDKVNEIIKREIAMKEKKDGSTSH